MLAQSSFLHFIVVPSIICWGGSHHGGCSSAELWRLLLRICCSFLLQPFIDVVIIATADVFIDAGVGSVAIVVVVDVMATSIVVCCCLGRSCCRGGRDHGWPPFTL